MAKGASGKIVAKFDEQSFKQAEQVLARIDIALREKALKKALREASKVVALTTRSYITKPGYKGDKDRGKYPPLNKNIKWVVRSKRQFIGGFVGADYKKTPHSHLYDQGHRMVGHKPGLVDSGHVAGKQDFARAIDTTKGRQTELIIKELKKFVAQKDWR